MRRDGRLRASDADRDQVVERLRAAATEGRLSSDELDERVHDALTALTYDDLEAVLDDLPRPRPREDRRPAHPARREDRTPVRRTVGSWAVDAVRANPLLLFVMIPVVATAGAMLLAAAITWMTLIAVVMLLGGGRFRHLHRRRGPWTLMWGAEDRVWDGRRLSR